MKQMSILDQFNDTLTVQELVEYAQIMSDNIESLRGYDLAQMVVSATIYDICQLFEWAYHLQRCYNKS